MSLEEAADRLAEAIRAACRDHGQPNNFLPRELQRLYGGPSAALCGRIGKRYMGRLYAALGGRERWGSAPVYSNGRFYV